MDQVVIDVTFPHSYPLDFMRLSRCCSSSQFLSSNGIGEDSQRTMKRPIRPV